MKALSSSFTHNAESIQCWLQNFNIRLWIIYCIRWTNNKASSTRVIKTVRDTGASTFPPQSAILLTPTKHIPDKRKTDNTQS